MAILEMFTTLQPQDRQEIQAHSIIHQHQGLHPLALQELSISIAQLEHQGQESSLFLVLSGPVPAQPTINMLMLIQDQAHPQGPPQAHPQALPQVHPQGPPQDTPTTTTKQ